MKQGKKWMLVAIALLTLVALPLVGCKNAADGTGDTHTHSYDETKWESDATNHWHPATCEHTDQKGSFAAHSYGDWEVQPLSTETESVKIIGKCVCGQSREIPDFVYVKGGIVAGSGSSGVFIAGRTVKLSDFFIGKYEVTQAEYASVMANQKVKVNEIEHTLNANPSEFISGSATDENQGKRPVENVSWYDAVWYCNALSEKEGLEKAYTITIKSLESPGNNEQGEKVYSISSADVELEKDANGYRLPTEAEWEYAARGGKPSTEDGAPWNYQWAGTNYENNSPEEKNNLEDYAWYKDTPGVGEKTHEVGKKKANSLGIHDMSGNVFEWCWDWHGTVGTGQETDPTGPTSGSLRVSRGGCWSYSANGCSVSNRDYSFPIIRNGDLGFRVVRPAR